jgi:tetratricopeptide (TPR) repeat protein
MNCRRETAGTSLRASMAVNFDESFSLDQLYERAVAALDLGRAEIAEKHLRRALVADPSNARVLATLALSRACQGDLLEAAAVAQEALALAPDDAFALRVRASVGAPGDPQDAVEYSREAVSADPQSAQAWHLLAVQCESFSNVPDAQEAAEQCLKLSPTHCGALLLLGRCHLRCSRKDKAIEVCRRVLSVHPDSEDAHQLLGDIARRYSNFREAASHYANALRSGTKDISLRNKYLDAIERSSRIYAAVSPFLAVGRWGGPVYKTVVLILVLTFAIASGTYITSQDPEMRIIAAMFALPFVAWGMAIGLGDRLANRLLRGGEVTRHVLADFRLRKHLRSRRTH